MGVVPPEGRPDRADGGGYGDCQGKLLQAWRRSQLSGYLRKRSSKAVLDFSIAAVSLGT
jgi:hypothetical protein